MSPLEALLDERQHVKALRFQRADGTTLDLPARTVCIAAGTSPNIMYEKGVPGHLRARRPRSSTLCPHVAKRDAAGELVLERAATSREGFFTSYLKDGHTVSFYGDNHPHYSGSVVKAMASAKDGYSRVVALFPEAGAGAQAVDALVQAARDQGLGAFFAKPRRGARRHGPCRVNRLTKTIVEIVVHAPMAARKFLPGQFYRLQNFETFAPLISVHRKGDGNGTPDIHARARLAMEGLALTGAWVDVEKGLLGTIVLEMGGSSRLCAALKPGEPIVLMGPTGQPTHIAEGETVLLCGGGLGNAVLFSIAARVQAPWEGRFFTSAGIVAARISSSVTTSRAGPIKSDLVHRHAARRSSRAVAQDKYFRRQHRRRRCTRMRRARWAARLAIPGSRR